MGIYRARRAEGLPLVQDGTHEKECGFNSCRDLAWVPREQNIEADELSNGGLGVST
jgi:hypothetical protein